LKFSELWQISKTVEQEQNFRSALLQAGVKKDMVLSEKDRALQRAMKSGGRFKYIIAFFYIMIVFSSTLPLFYSAAPVFLLNIKAITVASAYLSSFFIIFFFSMVRNSDPSVEEIFRFLRMQNLSDKDASTIIFLAWIRFYLPLLISAVILTPIAGYLSSGSLLFALANTFVLFADIAVAIALSFKVSKFMIIQTRRGNSGKSTTLIRIFTLLGYTISIGALYFAMLIPQSVYDYVLTANLNLLDPPYLYLLLIPFIGVAYLVSLILYPISLTTMQLLILGISLLLLILPALLSISSINSSIKDISQWRIKISGGKVTSEIRMKIRGALKSLIITDLRISLRDPSRMGILALPLFLPIFLIVFKLVGSSFMEFFMFGYFAAMAFIISIWSLLVFDVRGGSYLALLPLRSKTIAISKVILVSLLLIPGIATGLIIYYIDYGDFIVLMYPIILYLTLIGAGFVEIYIMAKMLGEGYIAVMKVESQVSAGIVTVLTLSPIIITPLILAYAVFQGILGVIVGLVIAVIFDMAFYRLLDLLRD